jgi:hypothetical protein
MLKNACFISLLCSLGFGCDNSYKLQTHMQEYQSRMANVLDVTPPDLITVNLPPYPAIKSLKHPISQTKIKLFEFYNLQHCQLYTLIAERNTTLGHLQLPSSRYIYEHNLIEALEQCLVQTSDPKLQNKLRTWQQQKVANLTYVWADLMQLSSEIKRTLSANTGFINGNELDGLSQTQHALRFLIELSLDQQISATKLEKHLQHLNNQPLLAKLWLSQLLLAEHLNRSTVWLEKQNHRLKCKNGSAEKQVEYLVNVFQLFFIDKIQPLAGQINNYHYQLSPLVDELSAHPTLSPSYKEYIKTFNTLGFADYQKAMSEHLEFWQGLFKRCNIKPGKQ